MRRGLVLEMIENDVMPDCHRRSVVQLELEPDARAVLIASVRLQSPALADDLENLVAGHEPFLASSFLESPSDLVGGLLDTLRGQPIGAYTLERLGPRDERGQGFRDRL